MILRKENSTYCSFIEIQGSGKFEIYNQFQAKIMNL